jgi:tetratricopeptide (TPR) repeat protein
LFGSIAAVFHVFALDGRFGHEQPANDEEEDRGAMAGSELVAQVAAAAGHIESIRVVTDPRYDELNALLPQANQACQLLQHHSDPIEYARNLLIKANIHVILGQDAIALANLREMDEMLLAEERKAFLNSGEQVFWRKGVHIMGVTFLSANQFESAKCCFVRLLSWPRMSTAERVNAFQGLTLYHKERKEWAEMIEPCEDAFKLVSEVDDENRPRGTTEMLLLLLMADAFEGQGDMRRAREYDEKANKAWFDQSGHIRESAALLDCRRREAIELLKAGKALEAFEALNVVPRIYKECLHHSGVNFAQSHKLGPVMTALRVMADALVEAGDAGVVLYAMRIRSGGRGGDGGHHGRELQRCVG